MGWAATGHLCIPGDHAGAPAHPPAKPGQRHSPLSEETQALHEEAAGSEAQPCPQPPRRAVGSNATRCLPSPPEIRQA